MPTRSPWDVVGGVSGGAVKHGVSYATRRTGSRHNLPAVVGDLRLQPASLSALGAEASEHDGQRRKALDDGIQLLRRWEVSEYEMLYRRV